jgi:hypothetical protein
MFNDYCRIGGLLLNIYNSSHGIFISRTSIIDNYYYYYLSWDYCRIGGVPPVAFMALAAKATG